MRYPPTCTPVAVVMAAMLLGLCAPARATMTENLGMQALPAAGRVTIDGKFDDWDLSGGLFACPDVEAARDRCSVWFHAMYDEQNLYLLARFRDETPLSSSKDPRADYGWNDDCLQVRIITAPGKPQEAVAHLACWKFKNIDTVELVYDRGFTGGYKGRNIVGAGAEQAFSVDADGKGYAQEIAVSWAALTRNGPVPKPGDGIVMTVQPWWGGPGWGMTVADLFNPAVTPDRVFTFSASRCWGPVALAPRGRIAPPPVRLADGREFAVHLEKGLAAVDWTGLIKSTDPRGFKPITFSMAADGFVSLIIRNKDGQVVRNLLNCSFHTKGKHTVLWDGLTTSLSDKLPGEAVPAGSYTWSAIMHAGIGLRLRGWAANGGNAPWDNGPGTNWGGDMGAPSSCAADGDSVLLGWAGSEAGKAAVLCDLQGNPRWSHKRGGFGGAWRVALDGGVAYVLDGTTLYKLDAADGSARIWNANGSGDLPLAALWEHPEAMPDGLIGMAARGGKLYLTFSDWDFRRSDVADWRKLVGSLKEPQGARAERIWAGLDKSAQERLAQWPGGRPDSVLRWNEAGRNRDALDDVIRTMNAALHAPPDAAPPQASRRAMEAEFAGAVVRRESDFLAVVDGAGGNLLKTLPVPAPGQLAAVSDTLVFAISGGANVLAVNPATGESRVALKDVGPASAVAVDAGGSTYVALSSPAHQVKVFAPDGRLVRTLGKPGGRAPTGPWDADAFRNVTGLAVDREGKLWIAECDFFPKRVSMWDAAGGKLLREFFGPTHYGASGGAIYPKDPNVMVGEACEWRLDPATGRGRCTGVLDTEMHGFARFCQGPGGRDYLAVLVPSFIGPNSPNRGMKVFERLGEGRYVLRSAVWLDGDATTFWADADGDAAQQPGEVQTLDRQLVLGGYMGWSLYVNSDLTIHAGTKKDNRPVQGLTIRVGSFTACGAPRYDLQHAAANAATAGAASSLDNSLLIATEGTSASWGQMFVCYDTRAGSRLWGYPSPYAGVHGSHEAPPADDGLIRGAFGIVGSAHLPKPLGDIWAVNTNVGEWHLLTADGYYLSRLFQPNPLKLRFPDKAQPGAVMDNAPAGAGGEDFGGSLTQAPDGKVYVEAGKTALWNLEMVGLDTVKALKGGKVALGEKDVVSARRAREECVQEMAGTRRTTIAKLTPVFTGELAADFTGAQIVEYKKSDDAAVRSAAAWDENNLYLGWEVHDPTPWVNGATEPQYLYARGDTVDFQLGTDPTADRNRAEAVRGDLRLSIGNFKGMPLAVLYRPIAKDKHPMTFSSGIVKDYRMESVRPLTDARIKVAVDEKRNLYVVEAAIPLGALDFTPAPDLKLRGDFGATHGDATGSDTRLRTYWSNRVTGIVDDEVFELKLEPKNWGEITFAR